MSKIKNNKQKILFAIADRDTEDYLSTVIKDDCKDIEIVGIVTYKEKIIQKVNQLEPDILLLRETLPGTLNITELLFELRYSYPNVRIIFLAGDRKPGDTFLITLVTYGIYDLLVGGHHKISDVIELINIPNTFKDVNYLIPKATLNEITNTMRFDTPLIVETNKKNIVVIEDDIKNSKLDTIDNNTKKSSFKKRKNKKESFNNNLNINKNLQNDEIMLEEIYDEDDFDFNNNKTDKFSTSFIDEDKANQIKNNKSILDDIFQEDSIKNNFDFDFDFDFNLNNKEDEGEDNFDFDFNLNNKEDEGEDNFDFDFNLNNKEDEGEDNFDFDFDLNNKEDKGEDNFDFDFDLNNKEDKGEDNFDFDFDLNNKENKDGDNLDFDFNSNNKDTMFEDEDFMIDIDLNNIKDNKDIPIDNILMEEECEDLLFIENIEVNNYQIEDLTKDTDELNILDKNNNHSFLEQENNKNQEDTYSLEDLTKEIESLKEENEKGFDLIEENYINDLVYNEEELEIDDYDEDYINDMKKYSEKSITTKTQKNKNFTSKFNKNQKVIVSRQKIISFIGGKNGIGTSSIAINTATKLAKLGHKVIYMELNTIHPTIGYWYQIGYSNKGIETAIKSVEKGRLEEINKSIISTSSLKKQNKKIYKNLPDNLDFLLFSKQETILRDKNKLSNPEALKDLFLKLMIDIGYDFVILDLDFDLNNMYTTTALNFSNLIYSVITQDVASLAYLLFKIEELEKKGYKIKNKSKYIVNRYESNGVEINLKDLKQWVQCKDICTMPDNNKDFINANANGIPLVLYTKDKTTQECFDDILSNILSDY